MCKAQWFSYNSKMPKRVRVKVAACPKFRSNEKIKHTHLKNESGLLSE